MSKESAISFLKEKDKEIIKWSSISAILSWDYETEIPEGAMAERAEQLSMVDSFIHSKITDERISDAVSELKEAKDLSEIEQILVHKWDRELKSRVNLPQEFVERLSLETNKSHPIWVKARETNDFSLFAPQLKVLIDLAKEKANYINPEKKAYDVLIDQYEEGMDSAQIDPIFADLKTSIHSILDNIAEKREIETSFLYSQYDEKKFHDYCTDLIKRLGFDFNRGKVAISAHPFTTELGMDDVRLTTRYSDTAFFDPIGSIVHEAGHGMFAQNANLNPITRNTSIAGSISMGIHESQSRFFENMIARDYHFWSGEYERLNKVIPGIREVSIEAFYRAINIAKPSAIRVNADEVTYNLHIILRYEMEKAIINGNVDVNDLPDMWNEMSKDIIRYTPKNNAEGILQDVHWNSSLFGYFPSYALGNIYSAMIREKLIQDIGGEHNFNTILESGDIRPVFNWLNNNIWQYGGMYTSAETVKRATGKDIDSKPFTDYLIDKVSKVYG